MTDLNVGSRKPISVIKVLTGSGEYATTFAAAIVGAAGKDGITDDEHKALTFTKVLLEQQGYIYAAPSGIKINAPSQSNVGALNTFSSNLSLGSTVLWDFGDGTNAVEFQPVHCYDAVGSYTATLTASNAYGVATSSNVIVISPAAITITASGSTTVGADLAISWESNSQFTSVTWDFGDGRTAPANTSDTVVYAAVGSYTLTVTGTLASGAMVTASHVVTVGAEIPKVGFNAAGDLSFGSAIHFSGWTAFSEVNDWAWDFGDGQASIDLAPHHIYQKAGDYTVTVTCNTVQGKRYSASQTLTVIANPISAPTNTNDLLIMVNPSWISDNNHIDLRDGTKAFDGSVDANNGCYHSNSDSTGKWVQIDFPTPRAISEVVLRQREGGGQVEATWQLQSSDDGINWAQLGENMALSINANAQARAAIISAAHPHYRISSSTEGYCIIGEAYLYESAA